MTYEIKDLEGVVLAMFDAFGTDQEAAAEAAFNEADEDNERIFNHMMDSLRTFEIDAIVTHTSLTIYTYTRSAQHAGVIQRTTWMIDKVGDLLPLSHIDLYEDTSRRDIDYTPGIYETFIY